MKKILLSLLVLFGVCGVLTAQTPYKVLEVHKKGEVTHTLNLSDIDSLTVEAVGETPETPDDPDVPGDLNGHAYVNLGLPSGTLWATCNVGAFLPSDNGDYFAWGETNPKAEYSWSTYKWYDDSSDTLTKYNETDRKTVLEAADDAATANWGSAWCMPTAEEWWELFFYCTRRWANGGCELKSPFNGNTIVLPLAGQNHLGSLAGFYGRYWSSSLKTNENAVYMYFSTQISDPGQTSNSRYVGHSVRPVRKKKEHEYVDLGLPSGTLWATCNVGADSPSDDGDYFAWGETAPKTIYYWSTYKWCNGSGNTQTKYCTMSEYGTVDNKKVLEAADDAATANWGSDWRMPTLEEMQELFRSCTWISKSGGQLLVGPNGNTIFLPAAGRRYDMSISDAGGYGYYWSPSLDADQPNVAKGLFFDSDRRGTSFYLRCDGLSVRPVRASVEK